MDQEGQRWDCIVVGGGAAGLSAALVLGRARRSTLVVDAGEQSNLPAHGIGGLLGSDGRSPGDFYAAGRAELEAYPSVEFRRGSVSGGERDGDGFVLAIDGGSKELSECVLLATGMEYRHSDLPGMAERWGESVFHCPFCHGWEVRERALCILDPGASGVHRGILLGAWSDDVALLTDGPAGFDDDGRAQLRDAGVEIDERPVAGVRGPGADIEAVEFADGSERPCGGLLVAITLHQRSGLAAQLGASAEDPGPMAEDWVAVDEIFRTGVPGLYAAGDLSAGMPSVANSVADGAKAAGAIVMDLMERASGGARG